MRSAGTRAGHAAKGGSLGQSPARCAPRSAHSAARHPFGRMQQRCAGQIKTSRHDRTAAISTTSPDQKRQHHNCQHHQRMPIENAIHPHRGTRASRAPAANSSHLGKLSGNADHLRLPGTRFRDGHVNFQPSQAASIPVPAASSGRKSSRSREPRPCPGKSRPRCRRNSRTGLP